MVGVGRMSIILVIDDEPEMLQGLVSLLELKGHTVRSAQNGATGLALMEEQTPDLVISDMKMPRMSGLALLKNIRSQPEWVSIPFILLSAFATEEDGQHALKIGAQEILSKPIRVEDFYRIVSKYV